MDQHHVYEHDDDVDEKNLEPKVKLYFQKEDADNAKSAMKQNFLVSIKVVKHVNWLLRVKVGKQRVNHHERSH